MTTPLLSTALIAEDHELFSDGIELLLQNMFPDATILRAGDFHAAWTLLQEHQHFDLMTLDLKMPGTKGLNGIRAIRNKYPNQRLAVLSSMDSNMIVNGVLALGVNAFISKSSQKQRLSEAIIKVLSGQLCVEAEDYEPLDSDLTRRQLQSLQLLAKGMSNKEIAKALAISPNTVKEYVSDIYEILHVDNRTQAVQKAQQIGLLFDSDF